MTIIFPTWVESTPCKTMSLTHVAPAGTSPETRHGAVKTVVTGMTARKVYPTRSITTNRMFPGINVPCRHGYTASICRLCIPTNPLVIIGASLNR